MCQLSRTAIVSPKAHRQISRRIAKKLETLAKEAYLFGSFPEGYAVRGESDFDLLIVPRRKVTYSKLWKLLDEEISFVLEKGLAPHIIIYRSRGMRSLLLRVRESGLRIL